MFDIPLVDVEALGDLEFCEGETVDLNALAATATSYQWAANGVDIPGETNQTLTVGEDAIYSVTVTDDNGCSASHQAPALIIGPAPTADLGADVWMCPEDSILLTATGGEFFEWSNGSTEQSILVAPEDVSEYSVIVTNSNCGLTAFDTIIVSLYDSPIALIDVEQDGLLEHTIEFFDGSNDSSIVDWIWDFGDGEMEYEQHPLHTFSTEETFTVVLTVESENGCLATDTVEVEIDQLIDIPNVFTPNDDGYNDQLEVENNGVTVYDFTIYNRWGLIVHHNVTSEIFWDGRTPAGVEVEAGTYFYVLKVTNEFSFNEGDFEQTGTFTLIR